MTTKAKVKQLEKKYNRITNKGKSQPMVVHKISFRGHKLIDENSYLLNRDEIKQIEEENKKIRDQGGLAVHLISYCEPKIRKS